MGPSNKIKIRAISISYRIAYSNYYKSVRRREHRLYWSLLVEQSWNLKSMTLSCSHILIGDAWSCRGYWLKLVFLKVFAIVCFKCIWWDDGDPFISPAPPPPSMKATITMWYCYEASLSLINRPLSPAQKLYTTWRDVFISAATEGLFWLLTRRGIL